MFFSTRICGKGKTPPEEAKIERRKQYMKTWKDRLNAAIEATQTKKADLAERLDTRRSTITNWTLGKSQTIDATTLAIICDYMGVSFRWVVFGEGEMIETGDFITVASINDHSKFATYSPGIVDYVLTGERTFEPRLAEGDRLFIDTRNKELKSASLYLFRDIESGALFVRRYFCEFLKKTHGLIDGLADESRPATYQLYPKDEFDEIMSGLEIVGRVIGYYCERI